MGIKLIKKTSEAVYKAIKNPGQAAFLIDCGSPEKAKELNDAFYKVAFVDNGWEPNKAVLGGELVQGWNVGQFFTACVDPCDKAVKWCEEWLRNSGGAAPGIQGNAAGLESKACEDTVMADEIQIKRDGNHYTATCNGRTLWIKHDYKIGTWDVEEPWATKNSDGTFKSKHLDSFDSLYKAKNYAARILSGDLKRPEAKACEDDVGTRLRGILNDNNVWSEVSGGDNDSLVDGILDGDWIGLMCGPDSDDAADWDAYIKDTFGSFKQYVEAEWFSPDENDPDFKTVHIKFKPRFALGDKGTQTSVLNRLGDKIADGYFAMAERKACEELSPKMKQRMKVNAWQEATDKMKGFDEAGHTFLDMMIGRDGNYLRIALPVEGMPTEAEARKIAEKIFGDFEDYINFGADFDDLDEAWFPYYGLKKEFFDLSKEEGLAVLKEFDDVLYKAITRGIKAFK